MLFLRVITESKRNTRQRILESEGNRRFGAPRSFLRTDRRLSAAIHAPFPVFGKSSRVIA